MFAKVASFEFRYQLRQPAFWVIAILFALIGFGMLAVPNISVSAGGNVFKNAPYFLAAIHVSMAVFFMLGSTVIVAAEAVEVAARHATTVAPRHSFI